MSVYILYCIILYCIVLYTISYQSYHIIEKLNVSEIKIVVSVKDRGGGGGWQNS